MVCHLILCRYFYMFEDDVHCNNLDCSNLRLTSNLCSLCIRTKINILFILVRLDWYHNFHSYDKLKPPLFLVFHSFPLKTPTPFQDKKKIRRTTNIPHPSETLLSSSSTSILNIWKDLHTYEVNFSIEIFLLFITGTITYTVEIRLKKLHRGDLST